MSTNDEIQDLLNGGGQSIDLITNRALSYAAGMLNEIALMKGAGTVSGQENDVAEYALEGILKRLREEKTDE